MILALRLALPLLLAGLCIFQGQGMSVPEDCCEATRDIRIHPKQLRWLKDYEIQGTDRGCRITAFVLITIRNRKLCYPLGSALAIKFKKFLDDKKARNWGRTQHGRRASSQD